LISVAVWSLTQVSNKAMHSRNNSEGATLNITQLKKLGGLLKTRRVPAPSASASPNASANLGNATPWEIPNTWHRIHVVSLGQT
jgi:hypothetical protein